MSLSTSPSRREPRWPCCFRRSWISSTDEGLWPTDAAAHSWRLSRVGGPSLDDSMTLRECDVRDGELLLLSATAIPAAEPVLTDPAEAVANTSPHGEGEQTARIIGAAACLWAVGAGALTLLRVGRRLGCVRQRRHIGGVGIRRRRRRGGPASHPSRPTAVFGAFHRRCRVHRGGRLPCGSGRPVSGQPVPRRSGRHDGVDRAAACHRLRHSMFDGRRQSVDAGGDGLSLRRCMDRCPLGWPERCSPPAALATLSVAAKLSILLSRLSPAMPTADGGMEEEPTTAEPREPASWPPNADRPRGGVLGGGRGGGGDWLRGAATATADTGWSAPCSPVSSGRC